ncbi:PepSY-associated TM helix domain-containing protein [Paenibacillus sp. S-38]|uniref:PepSY-associated TM helix domain-containing protein n=1 Tax=Paenibacillus sp. S-38 TaxID=3416710 RepID=UPI003CF563CC
MRKAMLSIHLFLSLILGLFIVITCTTGSLLLVEKDVESWLHPVRITSGTGEAPLPVLLQHANEAVPGMKADRVEYPADDKLYHIHLSKDGAGGKDGRTVYGDPATGEVFGQVHEERREPFATIYNLHRYFLLTNVIGRTSAASVVGILGMALTIILLTGLYLWWPGLRKWALGFRVIRNRGKFMFNMSLHKASGIISIPLLLILALTGTVNAFEKMIPGWVGFAAREEIPAAAMKSAASSEQMLPPDKIIEIVKSTYPDSELMRISLPAKAGQSYQVGLKDGISATSGANSTVYLDAASGEILYKTDPSLTINLYNAWRKGLHFGTYGGVITEIIYFVFGMMPLVLMITGLVIWRLKGNAKRRTRRKQAAAPAAA